MGQFEIESLLGDGKKRTEKEIAKELGIREANINRCLKKMLKTSQIHVEIREVPIRGRNNHFYDKEVKHWYLRVRVSSKKKVSKRNNK